MWQNATALRQDFCRGCCVRSRTFMREIAQVKGASAVIENKPALRSLGNELHSAPVVQTVQFTRVLFPFDYSERCRRAAAIVKSLVGRTGAHLTVLNVIADPRAEYPPGTRIFITPEECDEMLAFSKNFLQKFVNETFPDCAVDAMCTIGDVAQQIICAMKTGRSDLIMMPTRGQGGFRRLLLGSVTAKVLDEAACPVWTDAHTEENVRVMGFPPRSILCAVDTKEEGVRVIRYASELASLFSSTLRLMHVIPELDAVFKQLRPEVVRSYHADATNQIASLRDKAGVKADICIEEGTVSEQIQRAALACEADLVVIGRGHLQHFLGRLRTNAYAIIRESPCPVLSV
jgi:nucleotide-binding universal stress UspA family protein